MNRVDPQVPSVGEALSWAILFALAVVVLIILLASPRARSALRAAGVFLAWGTAGVIILSMVYFSTKEEPNTSLSPQERLGEWLLSAGESPVEGPQSLSLRERLGEGISRAGTTDVRPDWVDQPAALLDHTYRRSVASGLWSTPGECQQALEDKIGKAIDEYSESCFGDPQAAKSIGAPVSYPLLRSLIKQPIYVETVTASVGPMRQWHALLEFDDSARVDLYRAWRQGAVSRRLRYAGAGFGLTLAALATLAVYLKLDLATAGRHRRRLRWASALAILLVAAGAAGIWML